MSSIPEKEGLAPAYKIEKPTPAQVLMIRAKSERCTQSYLRVPECRRCNTGSPENIELILPIWYPLWRYYKIKWIHGYARNTNTSLATISLSPQLSEEWLSHRDISLKTRNHSLLLPIRKTAWSSIPNHSATTAFVSLFYRHTHEATGGSEGK